MYPYAKKWRWLQRHPQRHFLDALDRVDDLSSGAQAVLRRRRRTHAKWMLIRIMMLVPLSVGIVSSLIGVALDIFGSFEIADTALALFRRVSTTFATVFALLFFLATRIANQAFHDILAILHARSDISPSAK